jgi:hypothetical protein
LIVMVSVVAVFGALPSRPSAQGASRPPAAGTLHEGLDTLLDLYVRDGFVYYRALAGDRQRLDRYLTALDTASVGAAYDSWSPSEQAAFWVNAYNALVLHTVIEHYPIRGTASEYPPDSIRQIPGAFERREHRVAGRLVTLDAIEGTILPEFGDPRLYLALGRGAVGSPRLRSEAFVPTRLEAQLEAVSAECPTRSQCIAVDPLLNRVAVTPVVGWHEEEFQARYADEGSRFAARSPIERAVLAFVEPHLFTTELEFLAKDAFQLTYTDFDWRLNDLASR